MTQIVRLQMTDPLGRGMSWAFSRTEVQFDGTNLSIIVPINYDVRKGTGNIRIQNQTNAAISVYGTISPIEYLESNPTDAMANTKIWTLTLGSSAANGDYKDVVPPFSGLKLVGGAGCIGSAWMVNL